MFHESRKKAMISIAFMGLLSAGKSYANPDQSDVHHGQPRYELQQVLRSTTPGSPIFRDGYGQTVKLHGDRLFVAASFARDPAFPAALAPGAIYVYQRVGNGWVTKQIIQTGGNSDHIGAQDIEAKGDWLFFSLVGTPAGPVVPDNLINQNLKGSIQIYKYNSESGLYEFVQAIDEATSGINLTPTSPAGLDPTIPWFLNQQGASFGFNFDLDAENNRLLVGAQYQVNNGLMNSGAAYLFEFCRDTKRWELRQTLTNPRGIKANDAFGYDVALNGKVALISNGPMIQGPKYATVAENSSVFVYEVNARNNKYKILRHTQTLTGDQKTLPIGATFPGCVLPACFPNPPIGDAFGASLDLDGDWALIGAPLESKNPSIATYSGAAYFFKLEHKEHNKKLHFVKKQKIFSDDPQSYLTSFTVVDIEGCLAGISDPGRSGKNGDYQGGLMVFERKDDHWRQIQTLTDPNGTTNSFFGASVSIQDKEIAVGGAPFSSLGPVVLFQAIVGPPFHPSFLVPTFPVPATPVIIYECGH